MPWSTLQPIPPSAPTRSQPEDKRYDADVIVVGAGPSGSSAAYWLATAGLDVLLLEKTTFPREKVCGDGLTPRGTRALIEMGIDVSQQAGWLHNRGLRVIGGGQRLHLDWPELTSFPYYGLVRPRADLDALLAQQAVKAGARLHEQTTVTEPILDRTGRVVGVKARTADKAAARVPRPARAHLRGRQRQARPGARRAPQRQAPARRGRAPLLHEPEDARRLPRVVARTVGRRAERVEPAARLRLDLRHGRRHGQRRPRRAEQQRRVPEDRLPRHAHPLARQHPRGVGAARAERDLPDPRRRAADGVQPHPALPARHAARRRQRRLGQPVQRRGHPVRDGVGPLRRRGRDPGAGPRRRARRARRRCRPTPSGCGRSGAPTTASAASS